MRAILVAFFVTLYHVVISQNIGGFSPKLEWNFIENKRHQIIFNPENTESAFEFNHYLDTLSLENNSIGAERKKVPLVLRHQNTTPNGFVAFTPFRSEIYMTPHPNNFVLGSLNWNYLLALHEYQHVLQMSNSLNGIPKLAYFLGGEIFWSSTLGLSVPNWFFEGEAVRAESAMSYQGRWRIPHFMNGYRQMAYENSFYDYSIARNGSFRKEVPNHYKLGSIMVGYGLSLNKDKFWETTFKEASAYKSVFYPFSRALKRNSGLRVKDFYKRACENYKSNLTKVETFKYDFAWSAYQQDDLIRESFIYSEGSDTYYYRYQSNDNIPILIQHKNDVNKKIIELPFQIDGVFDVYNHQLITSASYVHPRWNQESYQDIVKYDLSTKGQKRITKGKRYFSPIWVENGESIITVEVNSDGKSSLIKLDSTGQFRKRFRNENEYYISYPKLFLKNKLLVNLRDKLGRNCLATYDLESETFQPITEWNFHQIGIPFVKNDSILFSASFVEIDHIFLYHNGKIEQLTFGNEPHYMPLINNGHLLFQSYNLQSSRYNSIPLNEIKARDLNMTSISPQSPFPLNDSLVIRPLTEKPFEDTIQKYKKGKHLLNLHSWTPIIEDPIFRLELITEDILGTFRGELTATYNRNEKGFGQEARLVYGQYYTVFSINVKNQIRNINRLNQADLKFSEKELSIGASWPLNYSSGVYIRNVNFSSNFGFKDYYNRIEKNGRDELWSTSFSQKLTLAKRRAVKNLSSPLGLSLNWQQSIGFNSTINQFKFFNSFSTKGLSKNHNLIIDFDVQFQDNPSIYAFENSFFVSRGYNSYQHNSQYRLGTNYHFPIVYPDFGALGLIYIYRIRGNAFTDLGQIKVRDIDANLISSGLELIFDLNLFNQFPISIGGRYSRILENVRLARNGNENQFDVFIAVSRFN